MKTKLLAVAIFIMVFALSPAWAQDPPIDEETAPEIAGDETPASELNEAPAPATDSGRRRLWEKTSIDELQGKDYPYTLQFWFGLFPRFGVAGGRFMDIEQKDDLTEEVAAGDAGTQQIYHRDIVNGLYYEFEFAELGLTYRYYEYLLSLSWVMGSASMHEYGRAKFLSGGSPNVSTLKLGVERRPLNLEITYGWDFAKLLRVKANYYLDLLPDLGEEIDESLLLMYGHWSVSETDRTARTDTILAGAEATWTGVGWWQPTIELGAIYQQVAERVQAPGYVGYTSATYATGNAGLWLGARMRFLPRWASF